VDVFASQRRCRLLRALAAAGGDASVRDLAAGIRTQETGRCADEIDPEIIDQLRYEIYDQHLPKLAATGIVEYDSTLDKLRLLDSTVRQKVGRALDD